MFRSGVSLVGSASRHGGAALRRPPRPVHLITSRVLGGTAGAAAAHATAAAAEVGSARMIGWWLAGMSGAVFGMVAVGG